MVSFSEPHRDFSQFTESLNSIESTAMTTVIHRLVQLLHRMDSQVLFQKTFLLQVEGWNHYPFISHVLQSTGVTVMDHPHPLAMQCKKGAARQGGLRRETIT
jgi:hypothetical protein